MNLLSDTVYFAKQGIHTNFLYHWLGVAEYFGKFTKFLTTSWGLKLGTLYSTIFFWVNFGTISVIENIGDLINSNRPGFMKF